MAPIVPEIIGVGEAGNAALDELADAHIGGVAGADHEIIVVEADAIGGIADIEPEQVVVLEEHAGLDREVQGLEAVGDGKRSEEHTSELQSLMRNSYAVFCLQKKTQRFQCGSYGISIHKSTHI